MIASSYSINSEAFLKSMEFRKYNTTESLKNIPSKQRRILERRNSDEYDDLYRVSLSADNPSYKVLVVQKDHVSNDTVLLLNTYVSHKDALGYPYSLRKSADQVYFYPRVFEAFINFLFSEDKILNITSSGDQYLIQKHSAQDSFFHLTILLKIGLTNEDQSQNSQIRSVWLNQKEYQFLLSRSSQILRDLNV